MRIKLVFMKFSYKGITEGKSISGIIEAASYDEALLSLYDKEIDVENLNLLSFSDAIKEHFSQLNKRMSKIRLEDLIVFTRQFATLFSAGVPISTVLERLSEQTTNINLNEIATQIKKDIDSGISLSDAFSKHDKVFSTLYINMLKVGEESGTLDIVLDRLSTILETDLDTRNKIKTATRYPKMVITAIIAAFGIIITFVIPKFAAMFAKFNAQLPLPTRILIGINNFAHTYWWLVLIMIAAAIASFKKYKSTEQGKEKIDEISLKIPIIGKLLHKIYISRMVRILGLLYKSGIAVVTALGIVSESTGNSVAKKSVLNIKTDIEAGSSISKPIQRSKFFPNVVSDMVSVGEDTGRLDEMLFKVADYYDEEINYSIKNLSSAIEPILLVFIAGMVLLLALGVFLPMWDMAKVIH